MPASTSEQASASAQAASADAAHDANVAALNARVDALQAQLDALERERSAADVRQQEQARAQESDHQKLRHLIKDGISLSGYLQVQYARSELSEDQLLQGGSPLNQNRFAVRRGRFRMKGRWRYVHMDLELDASNTRGPTASVRRASISGAWPSARAEDPPLLLLSAGLTEIPFGLELQQGQDEILFMERTTGSLALFAGPVDTGVKLDGALGPFRVQLAVMNGVPLDDRAGGPSNVDAVSAPDFIGRVGVDVRPRQDFRTSGGASFLTGKGFHPGSDATKSTLQWDDANADGQFSTSEVVQVAGRGALPSETFDHWAVGLDLGFELTTAWGASRLYGEAVLASNLDRSLYVADPLIQGSDIRELNYYIAYVQDVLRYGFVGGRYEVYDPNSDLFDSRRGESIPRDASLTTISPLVGLRYPGFGRITFQYDFIDDALARDRRGVPTDVANNQWTIRVQGEL